jgi:hypothetical protein
MSSIPDTPTVRRLCVSGSRSRRPQPPTPATDVASDPQLPRSGGWDSNPRPGDYESHGIHHCSRLQAAELGRSASLATSDNVARHHFAPRVAPRRGVQPPARVSPARCWGGRPSLQREGSQGPPLGKVRPPARPLRQAPHCGLGAVGLGDLGRRVWRSREGEGDH